MAPGQDPEKRLGRRVRMMAGVLMIMVAALVAAFGGGLLRLDSVLLGAIGAWLLQGREPVAARLPDILALTAVGIVFPLLVITVGLGAPPGFVAGAAGAGVVWIGGAFYLGVVWRRRLTASESRE